MSERGVQLVGSVKQIRFAEKIRAWWVAGQVERIAADKRIAAGDVSELVIGPQEEDTAAGFARIAASREVSLDAKLKVTSAKQWDESAEGQAFRIWGGQ
jgi:hypothetical protein